MQEITPSTKYQLILWLPVIFYAGLIYYLSSKSDLGIQIDIPFFDKFEHFVEYGVFGFLLIRAFFNTGFNLSRFSAFGLAVIVAFLYGISDELHQIFVPGRTASIFDALFDLIGSIFGSYIYQLRKFST